VANIGWGQTDHSLLLNTVAANNEFPEPFLELQVCQSFGLGAFSQHNESQRKPGRERVAFLLLLFYFREKGQWPFRDI